MQKTASRETFAARGRIFQAALLTLCLIAGPAFKAWAGDQDDLGPITLKTMGSLFFGGTVSRAADGATFHGDHGYAQYYIPQNSRNYPLVMWHGIGQSGKTYESTPDGRGRVLSGHQISPGRLFP